MSKISENSIRKICEVFSENEKLVDGDILKELAAVSDLTETKIMNIYREIYQKYKNDDPKDPYEWASTGRT